MEQFISSYFADAQAPVQDENLEKQAQAELFAKLAAENGIDLEKLSEAQIEHLWTETFSTKEAEFPPPKEEKKDEKEEKGEDKEEKAKEEHDKKKEAAAKIAEADFLGRYMAHAMVDEIRKEAAAQGEQSKEAAMPEALRKGLEAVKGGAGKAGKAVSGHMESVGKKVTEKATHVGTSNMKPGHAKAVGAAAHAAGAAAVGGAAVGGKKLHDHLKEKKSSALDELAAVEAVKIAHAGGWDAEEAGQLIGAAITNPELPESTKIAHVEDLAHAVEIRSLELLEAVGYPVTWNQG